MDEQNVVNEQVEQTTPAETTPQEQTQKSTPESVGAGETKSPLETSEQSIPYSRFREVNERMKRAEAELALKQQRELEQPVRSEPETDPYAGLSPEERAQTQSFINKFVMPEVAKQYQPFVQQVQTERLNKQIGEAKEFAGKFGINFDEKLPEVVDYLSRPENRGRLTATEAVRNLYFEEITGSVRNQSLTEVEKQRAELMEKKKQANMQGSTVAQGSVIQTDAAARAKMTPQQKLYADVKKGLELAKQGVRHPNVRGN